MRQIRQLRRRVESIEDELGIEPSDSDTSSETDELGAPSMRTVVEFVENEEADNHGASIGMTLDVAEALGMKRSRAEHEIEKLRRQGEVYEPQTDYLRVT